MLQALRNYLAKELLSIDMVHFPIENYRIPTSILPEIYTWCKEKHFEKNVALTLDHMPISIQDMPKLLFDLELTHEVAPSFHTFLEGNIWKLIWKNIKVTKLFLIKEDHTLFVHKRAVKNFPETVLNHLDITTELLNPADWYYSSKITMYQDHAGKWTGMFVINFMNDESHNFYRLTQFKD